MCAVRWHLTAGSTVFPKLVFPELPVPALLPCQHNGFVGGVFRSIANVVLSAALIPVVLLVVVSYPHWPCTSLGKRAGSAVGLRSQFCNRCLLMEVARFGWSVYQHFFMTWCSHYVFKGVQAYLWSDSDSVILPRAQCSWLDTDSQTYFIPFIMLSAPLTFPLSLSFPIYRPSPSHSIS